MTSLLALWAGLFMVADDPVSGVAIHPVAEQTAVVISVEGQPRYRDFKMEGPHRLVVDFLDAEHALPRDNFMGIDRGGIRAVRTSQYSSTIVRVVVELEEALDYTIEESEGVLRLLLDNPRGSFEPWSTAAYASGAAEPPAASTAPDPAGERSGRDARRAATSEPAARNLMAPDPEEGLLLQQETDRITVTFTETPIQNVLFTFAEFSGRSIVPGADIQGTVTADIRDQPWDVGLRAILEAQGLVARETESGIIRVDDISNLAEQEQVEPVVTRPFRVNYATAGEVQAAVQPLLSERGSISVGQGTNTIIVTDLPRIVDDVENLLGQLDIRTPQVQISARIIFVNRSDLSEFGIVYDLKDTQGNQLNTFTAGGRDLNDNGEIDFPDEQVEEDVVSLSGSSVAALGNANQTVGSPSLLALTSLVLGRHTLVSFIQALDELQLSEVRATPTLTVMDNNTARVQVGQETPLRVVEAGGQAAEGVIPQANVEFRETGIILEVTPHVTADEHILMELHAERSDAELASTDVGFIFNTQEADSRVLVRDGETVVIAGLTVTEESESQAGIPILMDLPLLGRLFRVTRNQMDEQDLMILVTPHIVRENLN